MENAGHPYTQYADKELILRDYLAVDRTILANERTFLAYMRTALGVFVAGVSFIQFFSTIAIHVLGWLFCVIAIVVVSLGIGRYRRVKGWLRHLGLAHSEGTR